MRLKVKSDFYNPIEAWVSARISEYVPKGSIVFHARLPFLILKIVNDG